MQSKIYVESLYQRMRPFAWSWILFLLAALLWLSALALSSSSWYRVITGSAYSSTLVGFALLVAGFTARVYISGRAPVTNMYESVIWVAAGTIVFAFILYAVHKQKIVMAAGTAVAAFCLIAADAAPAILDPSIQPLVPVLRSNYWLTIHVLTITLGYAAFALTMGLGDVSLFQYFKKPSTQVSQKIASLNQLTYRAMQFGVVLLAAGTILGGIWADESWGRFWGWDPKEVWALIALLAYVAILHGRFTGWVTQFGFAAWTVVGFLTVVMAWYGVNYVLGAGLHSYGFGGGGLPWVATVCGLQLLYVLAAAWVHHGRKAQKKKGNPDPGPGGGSRAKSVAERSGLNQFARTDSRLEKTFKKDLTNLVESAESSGVVWQKGPAGSNGVRPGLMTNAKGRADASRFK